MFKRTVTKNPKTELSINALDLLDASKEKYKESDSDTIYIPKQIQNKIKTYWKTNTKIHLHIK